jgi:hypothetical protein
LWLPYHRAEINGVTDDSGFEVSMLSDLSGLPLQPCEQSKPVRISLRIVHVHARNTILWVPIRWRGGGHSNATGWRRYVRAGEADVLRITVVTSLLG